MRNLSSNETFVCTGQQVMIVVDHVSDVVLSIYNTSGDYVPLYTFTESEAAMFPGYAGAQYQVTFASGTVDVHGSVL